MPFRKNWKKETPTPNSLPQSAIRVLTLQGNRAVRKIEKKKKFSRSIIKGLAEKYRQESHAQKKN